MSSYSDAIIQLQVGTRVTVYWEDDDQWYKGTVTELDKHDDERFLIEYNDGDVQWLDTSTTKYRASGKPDAFLKQETWSSENKKRRVSKLTVGSRVSVWWPLEKEYFTGTLTQIRGDTDDESSKTNKRHYIQYDDGDTQWLNLIHCRFKAVEKKAERLTVGSRVSVVNEQGRLYAATITKIRPERARPHRIQYDDCNKEKEWLNLNVHPFLNIDKPIPVESEKITALALKKRKREFQKNQSSLEDFESPKHKANRDRTEEEEKRRFKCQEVCAKCESLAKRPRATTCHHIFCKRCIEQHLQSSRTCLLCMVPITDTLVKFDPDHISFKPVEGLDRTTGQVKRNGSSASAISLQWPGLIPFRVIEACQSKRRDDREHHGYYWRFQGSKDRILLAGESIKEGVPIEQVDPNTLEIIRVFRSSRKAFEKTGVARCSIRRVLDRKGKATAGGFFWRFEGETHGPWPDPEPTNLNPVEQLDFETGDLLASYDSLAEAKRAMGVRPNSGCIREVCSRQGRATAYGFFWRWKGSKALPDHMMGVQKIVQIRRTRGGRVVKEFRTSREAQAYFGHQFCWSTVCRYCRENGYYKGYYWQYRMLKEKTSVEEELLGKRLRVKQPGLSDEWHEGKINAFDSATKKFEILFDCGIIKLCKLKDIQYEWKNDQGQKPVEQLALKTGAVLATFNSITDAANAIGPNASSNHIGAVCLGRYKSSSGFFWRYKGSDALPARPKGQRRVEQLCLETGRVIETYDSISAAAKAVGITSPGISYCCNGRNNSKSAKGFGWRFAQTDGE